ncbi:zinc ribbon domain-containing protein, partial [Anabaena sp. 4-3]
MIVCPNCNHPNPDGAVQCEACYTPLPATTNCPNCGATVQSDAAFCGQCGFNLHSSVSPAPATVVATVAPDVPVEVPPLVNPDPVLELLQPNALGIDPAASPLPPTAMAA